MPKSTNKTAKKLANEENVRYYGKHTDLDIRIRSVASAVINHNIEYVFPELFEIIKQKVLFSADVEWQIRKLTGESNLQHKIYPLIDSTHDTFVANLYDAETSPVIIPRIKEAEELKQDAQVFYDWAESVSGINEAEKLIESEASLLGTSYGIIGTRVQEIFESPEKQPELTDLPFVNHVSFFELFTEVGCVDFYKSRFKIRRKLMTINQIKEFYSNLIDLEGEKEINTGQRVKIEDFINHTSGEGLYSWDFNRIWQIKDYEKIYKQRCIERNIDRSPFDVGLYEDIFKVIIPEGGMHEIIERWSGSSLIIMVNGYILYDGDNPYGNIDPFGCVVYEQQPGTYRGRGIGQKIMPLQKEANMLFSSVNNGIKMHLFPDYAITKGSLKDINGGDVSQMQWQGGKVYRIPQGNAVTSEPFKAIHFVEYDVLALANRRLQEIRYEAQEIIGTNSYTQGGQGKVERSASAVSARVATLRTRLNPIVDSLNKFRQRTFYIWMYIAATQYPNKLLVRALNKDTVTFKEIKPSALLNKFDILIDRETAVSIRRAEAFANTIQTLNALTPFLSDQFGLPTIDVRDVVTNALNEGFLSNIEPLNEEGIKKMVDLQDSIAKYTSSKQPQQNPMQASNGMPTRDEVAALANTMPERGISMSQEELAALGL